MILSLNVPNFGPFYFPVHFSLHPGQNRSILEQTGDIVGLSGVIVSQNGFIVGQTVNIWGLSLVKVSQNGFIVGLFGVIVS